METRRKPDWLKIKVPIGTNYRHVKGVVRDHHLHTICTSGQCPNMGECWGAGTATFMILGEICTRSCKFCATKTGRPKPLDPNEPANVARSVQLMNLKHAVITSVDRDDLPDGGAAHWVETINKIKEVNPDTTMEVLIPDFDGKPELVKQIIDARPDIISHNLETIERLTPQVRSKAQYDISLKVLKTISDSGTVSKSGLMLGLGETLDEIYKTMDDLVANGCEILTMGQYLQPTKIHLPVEEYVHPDKFRALKEEGLRRGFRIVESGPLVRSSYHAERHIRPRVN
ncbi:lipoyl synthase [Prolixibacter denitrificans]|jgi:lipoic acid synthetase|uniref:Lipoyl synthase n=1 Tax=Prolixibacter denitrificans TaxID=1541063 RepID=A0A2P8CGW8_9BACT|nr:lipoyl synthase [Prolixibacter denitrificans]PSK84220.1 lipoic acid synthetase [Prolixibacter denitrificans]GET20394.1 lipoyl synthase [Prolixibacter denitrificans]